ncbi:MAG: hypothetical protein FWE48_03050 [Coriobacteriia bacterium]|nr:hypothetical protein [Coriobacteriia bacterium]MCL2870760.1 hypothetical protein [Coriobacteriia bacterium]
MNTLTKYSYGVKLSLVTTIAILYLQAITIYWVAPLESPDISLRIYEEAFQIGYPAAFFFALFLGLLASVCYGVFFYFLKGALGRAVSTRALTVTACSGVVSIMAITVMHLINPFYALEIVLEDSVAISPHAFSVLAFSSLAL